MLLCNNYDYNAYVYVEIALSSASMIVGLLLSMLFNWCQRNVLLCVAELLPCSSSWMMQQMRLKR